MSGYEWPGTWREVGPRLTSLLVEREVFSGPGQAQMAVEQLSQVTVLSDPVEFVRSGEWERARALWVALEQAVAAANNDDLFDLGLLA
ncbi:hypothetical protein SAMN06264364_14920 [Quadrisphaera granulorum]|uniref:Uncharacterized protein n=1 Tax=Quadrisphaera granulorum TaxID=317664 RepID=A0A315ZNR0_9ACTN|nr:hypothetical protein [Quadrisphaera granulorum]PWJ46284.1 hypothetical protein BXY45_14920 [Quadrisphaera granulorum]SZE99099.1 hypothetical protein SAMN06264364_14920 [Quadrisphaera granulorum]